MSKVLSDISEYVTDKIEFSLLDENTYVGMDNLIPNRGGKTISEYVPSEGQFTAFKKGDVLIGNIRPYFKKIWLAEYNGGCSPDVLCLRAKEKVSSLFLYAVLAQDAFFDYDVKGAKGSKMPRGDKDHIMAYPVPEINNPENVGMLINSIYRKIQNNTAICSDLEAMAKLLYDYWFVQFDFPDENGKPYKSSGGKMVWNEELKREIPEGWEASTIADIAMLNQNSIFPSNDVLYHHYSIPSFDEGKLPANESGDAIASNKYLVPDNSVLVSKLNPQFKRIWLIETPQENAICSTEFLPVQAQKAGVYYLYEVLNTDAFSTHLRQKASSSTGSRKRIDPENCMSFQIAYNEEVATNFNRKVMASLTFINRLVLENQQLASLRDFLLPMLMNGQVKVQPTK